jgi:hypothetical protein
VTWVPPRVLVLGVILTAAPPAGAISPLPSGLREHLVGEVSYPTLTAGKFLNIRLNLALPLGINTQGPTEFTGQFSCHPRRGLGMYTGQCPLSRGPLTGAFTTEVGETGVSPPFYHVMFQVSGNGTTCDFSAFAPYLWLSYAIYTMDGAYQCSDGTGTTTQAGRFSAVRR